MWARKQPELAKALGFDRKTPCLATFHNLYKRLNTGKLEQTLTHWVTKTLENRGHPFTSRLTAVAMDGKSLRGTATPQTPQRHLLAAVSHELAIPLAQCAVSEKTNEVPVSTALLKAFDVAGKVITTDALLTQRTFCQDVLAQQADYPYPSKPIRSSSLKTSETFFNPSLAAVPPMPRPHSSHSCTQKPRHICRRTRQRKKHAVL